MSFIDPDLLNPNEIVAHYILDRRKQGMFLKRAEYQIINNWLKCGASPEHIVLTIEQIMEEKGLLEPPALATIHKRVSGKLSLLNQPKSVNVQK